MTQEDSSFIYKLRPEHGDLIATALDHYLSCFSSNLPKHVIEETEVMIAQMDFLSGNYDEDLDSDEDPNAWWYEDAIEAIEYVKDEFLEKEEILHKPPENLVCLASERRSREKAQAR